MSAKFEQVKNFYFMGVWADTQIRNAVLKKWITAEEYEQITGKKYE